MRVLISGASGLVGTEVAKQLQALGHTPLRLVRREKRSADEVSWDPGKLEIETGIMETIDAVVNMAGATTGKIPWTKKYMQELIDSRINSTKTLVNAINEAKTKPKVLISGSASGIYGDRGDQWLSEDASKGEGFLSDLASAWEKEALKADTRVVLARTTLVMSKKLGALGRLIPLIKMFVGGPLGSGKQWWAWISLEDQAGAIIHLINTPAANGPFNLTAPEPATAGEMIRELGRQLKRPTWLMVPAFAMRLLIGVAAQELLLCSQKMTADKLVATGFKHKQPTLKESVAYVLEK
jgi:uncharacterized protein (TIGR01777 family)